MSGEVTEVVRTPHVPLIDDRARREQKQKKERREAPGPGLPDDGPAPPDPTHGRIDIIATPPA